MPSLSIEVPEDITIDIVALECAIDWTRDIEDLRRGLADFDAATQIDETSRAKNLRQALATMESTLRGHVGSIPGEIKSVAKSSGAESVPEHIWTGEISQLLERLSAWYQTYTQASTYEQLKDQAEKLCAELNAKTRFIYPAVIQNATVDLTTLHKLVWPLSARVTVEATHIPFTTERLPSTFGRRSGFTLLLLAILLAFVAFVLNPPASVAQYLEFMPSRANGVSDDDLREPITALLLLFPGALYGQFFVSRPRSRAAHRAQVGTFVALSVVFLLPVIPAAMVATGVSLDDASAMLFGVALAAAMAGGVVIGAFNKWSLSKMRLDEIIASVRKHGNKVVALA